MRRTLLRLLTFVIPDRVARRIIPSTPRIVIYGHSGSKATHHLDTSNVLPVHRVSSCDNRTSYVPCLQLPDLPDLPLTMWAGRVTIDILPDDVLLHIFHLSRVTYFEGVNRMIDARINRIAARESDVRLSHPPLEWRQLVHVCQRWRSVVFASSNFLDLKLVCGPRTRVELIDIWPPLPIVVRNMPDSSMPNHYDFDAAIVHHNRVCEINLYRLSSSQLLRLASVMQGQFPALTHLMLDFRVSYHHPDPDPALLEEFSAPRLQSLRLHSIPFPALPKLLLSAADLVDLTLVGIPQTGYFSPVALVTGLTVSANLKSLTIGFKSPLSGPDRESRLPPSTTRSVLPALTRFYFQGISEYLEDFVAQIDAPLLESIWITFFNQLIFDIAQLAQFMGRATRFQAFSEAHVDFYSSCVQIGSWSRPSNDGSGLRISSTELDWQLSSLAQVLTSFFPFTYMLEHLYIDGPRPLPSQWLDDIEDVQWLEIFRPFTAVKNLHVCEKFAQCIVFALNEFVVEGMTEVLPTLESLFLEQHRPSGPVQEAIGKFVASREILGHPVAVSHWNRTREAQLRRF